MLDFLLFAVSGIIALVVLLVWYFFTKDTPSSNPITPTTVSPSKAKPVPSWEKEPSDPELGDLGLLSQHGSLHQYLVRLHDHGRQPIVSFWWGTQRVVSICNSEMFKDTLKLTYRPKLLFTLFEPLLTPLSIQYANGLDWEERQRALYPTLRNECLESYIPCFIEIANETVDHWSKLSPDTEIELQEEFMTMTIKGITRTCLGNAFNDEEEIRKMAKSYHTVWDEMEQRLHTGPPEPGSDREQGFNSSFGYMKSKVLKVVKDRENGIDTTEIPFIDALLQLRVPDEQVIADCVTFMVGGFHTSGYLLIWSVYYMTLYPEVLEKVVQEMRDQVGSNRGDKLKNYVYSTTTYLRQVLDESLRMSTLAPYAARYSDHDIVVGGYFVPAGTPITQALGVSLKNECVWKSVEKFDPSRFAGGGFQGKESLNYAPFGMGRRKCPGYVFSYVEVGVFLTILLQQFSLKPGAGGPKSVGKVHGLVTSPDKPLNFTVHPI